MNPWEPDVCLETVHSVLQRSDITPLSLSSCLFLYPDQLSFSELMRIPSYFVGFPLSCCKHSLSVALWAAVVCEYNLSGIWGHVGTCNYLARAEWGPVIIWWGPWQVMTMMSEGFHRSVINHCEGEGTKKPNTGPSGKQGINIEQSELLLNCVIFCCFKLFVLSFFFCGHKFNMWFNFEIGTFNFWYSELICYLLVFFWLMMTHY